MVAPITGILKKKIITDITVGMYFTNFSFYPVFTNNSSSLQYVINPDLKRVLAQSAKQRTQIH